MMKPQTLLEAFEVDVLQEQAVNLSFKKFKATSKWSIDPGGQTQKTNTCRTLGNNPPKALDSN